jgi:hypothetical protein
LWLLQHADLGVDDLVEQSLHQILLLGHAYPSGSSFAAAAAR